MRRQTERIEVRRRFYPKRRRSPKAIQCSGQPVGPWRLADHSIMKRFFSKDNYTAPRQKYQKKCANTEMSGGHFRSRFQKKPEGV
jgi:hypothetical protein